MSRGQYYGYRTEYSRGRSSRNDSYGRGTGSSYGAASGFSYYYGTEAPELYPYPEEPEVPSRKKRQTGSRHSSRKAQNRTATGSRRAYAPRTQARPKVQHLNPVAILVMVGVVAIMSLCMIEYLQLQTQVTNTVQEVASLESQYNKLKQSNDEALNQLNSSINLDEIKYKAMTELGMTYPEENQLVTYTNDDSDYVHQVTEVK